VVFQFSTHLRVCRLKPNQLESTNTRNLKVIRGEEKIAREGTIL
jgi:hypothetical protein